MRDFETNTATEQYRARVKRKHEPVIGRRAAHTRRHRETFTFSCLCIQNVVESYGCIYRHVRKASDSSRKIVNRETCSTQSAIFVSLGIRIQTPLLPAFPRTISGVSSNSLYWGLASLVSGVLQWHNWTDESPYKVHAIVVRDVPMLRMQAISMINNWMLALVCLYIVISLKIRQWIV